MALVPDNAANAVYLRQELRLLHASIADAIALGATELSFGRTALEPKARLGAKPQADSTPVQKLVVKPRKAAAPAKSAAKSTGKTGTAAKAPARKAPARKSADKR